MCFSMSTLFSFFQIINVSIFFNQVRLDVLLGEICASYADAVSTNQRLCTLGFHPTEAVTKKESVPLLLEVCCPPSTLALRGGGISFSVITHKRSSSL